MPCRYIWTEQSHIALQNTFSNPLIKQSIEKIMGKEIDLNDHFIEAAADELDEIFHTAADISFKQMKTKKRNKVSQKWFDLDLNIMKKKVDEKAKHMSRYPNDPYIRGSFFKSYKTYAKLRKIKKREFKQAILDKLEHLQSNNPKEYWKLINMLKEKSDDRPENSIDDQEWFNYFSHLSSIPNHNNESIEKIK
jgi:hypothetical protein